MEDYRAISGEHISFRFDGLAMRTCTRTYCDYCDRNTLRLVQYRAFYKDSSQSIDWVNNETDLYFNSHIGICNQCMRGWINRCMPYIDRTVGESLVLTKEILVQNCSQDVENIIMSFLK